MLPIVDTTFHLQHPRAVQALRSDQQNSVIIGVLAYRCTVIQGYCHTTFCPTRVLSYKGTGIQRYCHTWFLFNMDSVIQAVRSYRDNVIKWYSGTAMQCLFLPKRVLSYKSYIIQECCHTRELSYKSTVIQGYCHTRVLSYNFDVIYIWD